jgi:hypothetical protein
MRAVTPQSESTYILLLLLLLPRFVLQDACNSNASFDLSGEQLLAAIQEMENAQSIVKVRQWGLLWGRSMQQQGGAVPAVVI